MFGILSNKAEKVFPSLFCHHEDEHDFTDRKILILPKDA